MILNKNELKSLVSQKLKIFDIFFNELDLLTK